MNWIKKQRKHLRLWVQVLFTALTNGYVIGFTEGKIYRGTSKKLCVPGLNCYSCPGAVGSCPIGSLQAVLGSHPDLWRHGAEVAVEQEAPVGTHQEDR